MRPDRPFLLCGVFFLTCALAALPRAHAESAGPSRTLKTRYTDIAYPSTKVLSDFFWRISGKRFAFEGDTDTAASRVDRLAERVQEILDMRPSGFRVKVELIPVFQGGDIAVYSAETGTIRVHTDKVTDGVFAHELAHAVMHRFFSSSPPRKVQEILAQYVDKHLWEDY